MMQPMTFDASLYGNFMRTYFSRAKKLLRLTNTVDAEQFYGFHCNQVETVHLHKHGVGKGCWFRLKDGRVFDWLGRPDETDRTYYEARAH